MDIQFLLDHGLEVAVFGKDLQSLNRKSKLFIVVTKRKVGEDELYLPWTLPEDDMSKLKKWIRCGDPKHTLPEWNTVQIPEWNLDNIKVYLAGDGVGVDCTNVMDDMFAEENGKKYTYAMNIGRQKVTKTKHPQEYLRLDEHFAHLWRSAKTFSDFYSPNRKFLLGEYPSTISYVGLDEETKSLVPGLLRLHDFGFLTDGSQPYDQYGPIRENGVWLEAQQRPFIQFYVPRTGHITKEMSLEFFKRLKSRPEIVVFAMEFSPIRVIAGSQTHYGVTRHRVAVSRVGLENGKWTVSASIGNILKQDEEEIFSLDAFKQANPLSIEVAAKKWEDDIDLAQLIEVVANECRIPCLS